MKITDTGAPTVFADPNKRPGFIEIQSSPAAFGGATAAALGRTGQDLDRLGDKLFNQAMVSQGLYNETIAKDADVAASKELLDLQFDPKDGYMTKKGKNAVDAYHSTLTQAEEVRQRHLSALPNDDAKKMFDSVFVRRLQFSMEGIASHASRENLTWMNDTSKAREANIASEGVLNWNNLKRFNDVTIPGITGEVTSRMEMNGYAADSDVTKHEVQTAIDAAHVQRLQAMVPYAPKDAINQLDEVGKQLSGAGRIHAEEVVLHGIRLAHEEESWNRQREEEDRRKNDEKIGQGFFTQFKNGTLTPNAIDKSTLSTPQKAHWWGLVDMQSRRDDRLERSNPDTQVEVLRRIDLPYGDPQKITDPNEILPFIGHGLNLGQGESFQRMVQNSRTADGQLLSSERSRAFVNFKQEFTGDSGSIRDVVGGRSYMEFQQAVIAKERELIKDKKDPHQIYDPSNENYVGKIADRFKRTLAQKLKSQIDAIRGDPSNLDMGAKAKALSPELQRQSGESMDDWLRRTSGH